MLLANGPRQPELTHEIIRRELYQYVFPSPYYPIIGRERDMSELIDRLINQKLPVVCVVGTVGDGKTELVWHVVCRAVDEGHFSAFDWVADRSMYIDSNGNPRPTGLPPLTTSAIYNSMVRHFAWDDLKLCVTDLAERCAKRFREGHYCLVLDNMETQEQLERFLRELSLLVQPNPPRTSRILVTSRVQVSAPFVDYMPLRGLERDAALEYIKHIESRSQGIVISSTDRELLAERTGGNPLFIQIALARYAKNGRNMRQVVDQMRQGSGFFATFQNLFGELYQALSDAAKRVALSAAHYTEEITRDDLEADAAHYLADLDLFEQALTELAAQHVLKPSEVVGCYTIHPLMRAYLVQILRRDAD
ncbi:MAG: NB-ARC domain-containing protein [Anaerolineae bacterium]|nr:NB-ARC domain-containing protein [Anaerolineae bacterium]